MSDGKGQLPDEKLYKVLSHKVRRRLIMLIGNLGEASYTQIAGEVKLEPGTLYHHIDYLRDFIFQDADKRYRLTDMGKAAYRILRENEFVFDNCSVGGSRRGGGLARLLSLSPLYSFVVKAPARFLLEACLVIGLAGFFSVISGLTSVGLFYTRLVSSSVLINVFAVFVTWFVLSVITEVVTRYFFGSRGGFVLTLVNVGFAFLPYLVYLGVFACVNFLFVVPGPLVDPFSMVGLVLAQMWFLVTFAKSVQYAKGVSRSQAALIGLGAYYLNLVFLVLLLL